MGRYGQTQNGAASGRYSPIDDFRYDPAATLTTTPGNGTYFSINGGTTNINTYNGTGGGDFSDWSGLTADPYNASLNIGTQLDPSAGDVRLLDVIGYDLIPEPTALPLLIGAAALLRRRRRNRVVG
jgi:hypothetical protein